MSRSGLVRLVFAIDRYSGRQDPGADPGARDNTASEASKRVFRLLHVQVPIGSSPLVNLTAGV
jgi:hypothetical protein